MVGAFLPQRISQLLEKKKEKEKRKKPCNICIVFQVEYKKDLENTKGHSINFCETPQFINAAKVAKFTSDVSLLKN